LSTLAELDLRFNALETLPEALAGMTGLRFLDLRANALSTLPSAFRELEKRGCLIYT